MSAWFARPAPLRDVHFAAFADHRYAGSVIRIAREARVFFARGAIHAYGEDHLRATGYWREHGAFVESHRKGFGLWTWKPYLVGTTLRAMPEDAVLVYADAGCTLNRDGRATLERFVAAARGEPDGLVAFTVPRRLGNAEVRWTKRLVREHFGCVDEACLRRPQIMATAFVIRNTPGNRDFVDRWYELCTRDGYRLVDDEVADDEHPEFVQHRYDQSLWSLLVKGRHATVLDDQIEGEPPTSPIWATRLKHRKPNKPRRRGRHIARGAVGSGPGPQRAPTHPGGDLR